jgi:hypothetical protein
MLAVAALSEFTVMEAALRRPTLDDAFLALAGESDGAEQAEAALAAEAAR